jgi:hypothetical protein
MRALSTVVILLFLAVAATPSGAAEFIKTCARVEVISMTITSETSVDWPLATKAGIVELPQSSVTQSALRKTLAVIAYGPILGSAMNSPNVETDLACTPQGFTLGVTIMHLGDGDALKNALWRPKITLHLVLWRDTFLKMVWRMRRPNGTQVDHAQTPPYPEQRYPVVVIKTLSPTP